MASRPNKGGLARKDCDMDGLKGHVINFLVVTLVVFVALFLDSYIGLTEIGSPS
jgi:hypothetical protein